MMTTGASELEAEVARALAVAFEAADEARALIRGAGERRLETEAKADGSPVTAIDTAVEGLIRSHLKAAFPEHGIRGEELDDVDGQSRWDWVIDPIDGTVGFSHGVPLAATLLCLRHEAEPVLSILDLPAMGRRLHAIRGRGAFEGARRVRVTPDFHPERDVVCHGDRYTFSMSGHEGWYDAASDALKFFRSYTDAFGHYLVARGSAAVVVDAAMEVWELAPTRLLVEEAGGVVEVFPDQNDEQRRTVISGCTSGVRWMRELFVSAQTGE